jgi:hypothetical protein
VCRWSTPYKAHADTVRHTVGTARLVVARKRRAVLYREVVRVTDPLSHAVDARRDLVPLSRNGFVVDLQRFAHSTIVDLAADKPSRHARPRCLTLAGFGGHRSSTRAHLTCTYACL